MTNSPNSGNQPEHQPASRRKRWLWAGAAASGVVLTGTAAGAWWAWRFVNNDLAPMVSKNMSDLFDRPVQLGTLEQVSLTHLKFGPSAMPPTATDADQIKVEAVEVQFNPLEVLWDRRLSLDVTLVNPEAYVDQDQEGQWITTQIKNEGGGEETVKIELDQLRVKNATLRLAPYGGEVEQSAIVPPETVNLPDNANPANETNQPDPDNSPSPTSAQGNSPKRAQPILVIREVNGTSAFREDNQLITFDVTGKPETGGDFRLAGKADLKRSEITLNTQGNDVLAADVSLLVPLPLQLKAGRMDADLEVLFPPNNQPMALNGTVRLQNVTARADEVPQLITNVNGGLRFQDQQITMQNIRGRYGEVNAAIGGSLDTQKGYDLTVQVQPTRIEDVLKTLEVEAAALPIELSGTFRANAQVKGSIDRPVITGLAENTQPVRIDQVEFSSTRAQFQATLDSIAIQEIRAIPAAGGLLTGTGNVQLADRQLTFDLRAQGIPGDTLARTYGANLGEITLGTLEAEAQVSGNFDNVETLIRWQAPQAIYPGRGTIAIADGKIRFRDTLLLVAGGLVKGQGEIAQNRWQATLDTSGIELSQFSPDLQGLLSGSFRLGGNLDNLSLAATQAEGQVRLSEGLALITSPLTASVRWLGDRLEIQDASATGFSANGFVFAQLEGTPEITQLDLNVNVRGYDLAQLPIPPQVQAQVQVNGRTDFSGRLTGTPQALTVAGRVGLNDLVVNEAAFEPALNGNLRYVANQSLDFEVAGVQDRIAVALDGQNRPLSFFVQQGDAIAEGKGSGERLVATLQNFPIDILNLAPAADYGLGRVTGLANGTFNINLANLSQPDVVGEVAIANPALDYIKADSFTGQFRYIGGIGVLEQGELRQGNSLYLLSGNFSPTADPQFQGKIEARQGKIEDILVALKIFELSDFGRGLGAPTFASAIDVVPTEVSTVNLSLLNQLRRSAEIAALRDQEIARREQEAFLPELSEFQGAFNGEINLAFSPKNGPSVDFDLDGANWSWGQYQVNQVDLKGDFKNGILTLLPLQFQSDQSLLRFAGTLGGAEQSGQLLAKNVPVAVLRDLFKLPIAIDGNLNVNASLSGSVGNPQVQGELILAGATVNSQAVPPVSTLFGYSDARLDFTGQVIGDESNAFNLKGSVPYAFQFMTIAPKTYDLSLDVNIRNNGLALLQLFTDQIAWEGGEGEVALQVRGLLNPDASYAPVRLAASGNATLKDATFSAQALPENITNVNGNILFNTDRIEVQSLQGQFSSGKIAAQGTIPLLIPLSGSDPNAATPLTVDLDRIGLDLKDQYRGDVNGNVIVTGTALAPQIGGEIRLSNGRVILVNEQPGAPVATAAGAAGAPRNTAVFMPQFNNLQVILGDRIRITSYPILDFLARGELTINGTMDNLSPDGTIALRRGQINLFATQFNLQRDYDNRAVFTPTRGLDPYIDVRLIASVPEVVRPPVANTNSPFGVAELADPTAIASTGFGSIQTIRVEASVTGPASQISNNIELTSSPSRTESELVALIGGNFLSSVTQASDNPTLALASVAGSTLLTRLQNLISDATGLTDFRLFTTTVSSENARSSTLGLAAELGFDITDNLSISALRILTADDPTRFNLRYRINDELLLRGSTDLNDDNRAVLEFETRF